MEDSTNKLIREFYLGDDAAWGKVVNALSNKMQIRFRQQFSNLAQAERDGCLAKFEVEFFYKVRKARIKADKCLKNDLQNVSLDEKNRLKLEYCADATKFDLERGKKFKGWMWKCLFNLGRDAFRKQTNQPEIIDVADETNPIPPTLPEQSKLTDENVIRQLLETALKGDEIIYLKIWFRQYAEPSAELVKSAVERETGKIVSDAYVTKLKQKFLMKSYLKLLEHIDKANSLASLFQKLMKTTSIYEEMFGIMMENVWQTFYEDKKTVVMSKNKICRELWKKRESLKLKKDVQKQILLKSYRHFRHFKPPPQFCYKIEFYADNRFGEKIRELFIEGDN